MKKLFGTDGIRAEAGKFPLDEQTTRRIGYSLATHFGASSGKSPRFVTGRDTRESGDWIEESLSSGAVAAGAVCESAGVITTPGVAFLTRSENFDAGIVISASHNPFHDNGIKVFLKSGKKLGEEAEKQIEADIFGGMIGSIPTINVNSENAEVYQRSYLESLTNGFNGLTLEGTKVVLDCANGAAFRLAPALFTGLGAEVIAINAEPDGKNINFDCGSLHLEGLQQKVLEEQASLGVAFDGDADRSLFVDEKGDLVDGDATLWIMAKHLLAHGELSNKSVVATVMSNIGLEVAMKSERIDLIRTPVGDKYVLRELLKSGSSVGGEQSGHIIFPERSLVGDGMQTALYLLAARTESGQSVSGMRSGFTQFPQILVNVKVSEKPPFEDIDEISSEAEAIENELGDEGRLLLRYSGTENLARVMIEGQDQSEIEEKANRLAAVIGKRLG